MKQKERLVQLIIDSVNGCARNWAEVIADHLLANGVLVIDTDVVSMKNRPLISSVASLPIDEVIDLVKAKMEGRLIVPPCKLGDTVWDVYDPKWTHTVSQITQKANGTLKIRLTCSRSRSVHEIESDDIGNNYFLSREEAEKALAETTDKNLQE